MRLVRQVLPRLSGRGNSFARQCAVLPDTMEQGLVSISGDQGIRDTCCQHMLTWNGPSELPIFFDESAIEKWIEEEDGDDDRDTHYAKDCAYNCPSR